MTSKIETVDLPGIGVRSTFATNSGAEVGVLSHNTGEREILVYSPEDRDRCSSMMKLDPVEAQTVTDLLGVRTGEPILRLGNLVVRPATIAPDSRFVGRSLSDAELGVSVLAIVRNEMPLPTTSAVLSGGDVVIIAAAAEDAALAIEKLDSGL